MKSFVRRFEQQNWFKVLSKKNFMPVIWSSLVSALLAYFSSLIRLPAVGQIIIVFLLINCSLSFYLGRIMHQRHLAWYWLLLFPLVFSLVIWSNFHSYNYPLALVYLIWEGLGTLAGDLYREKRRS